MNDFETTLLKLAEEAGSLQKQELTLRTETQLFNQKFMGFLKQNGLPEDFTLPQLALLSVKKSRELIKL
jgi:hypothetical protein